MFKKLHKTNREAYIGAIIITVCLAIGIIALLVSNQKLSFFIFSMIFLLTVLAFISLFIILAIPSVLTFVNLGLIKIIQYSTGDKENKAIRILYKINRMMNKIWIEDLL